VGTHLPLNAPPCASVHLHPGATEGNGRERNYFRALMLLHAAPVFVKGGALCRPTRRRCEPPGRERPPSLASSAVSGPSRRVAHVPAGVVNSSRKRVTRG
jgi:hypothetical protein